MNYAARKQQISLDLDMQTADPNVELVPEEPPSYFDAGEEQMFAEDDSRAEVNAEQRFFGDRNDTIKEMIDAGEVSEEMIEQYTKVVGYDSELNEEYTGIDYDGMATALNEQGYDFEASDERMVQTMAEERYAREELFRRGDTMDQLAWMAGGLWATAKDPYVLASMLVPVGGQYQASKGFVSNLARFTGLHAAVGAASEAPLQKEIFDFKQRIGSEYGLGDVMMNVGFAAFASGAMGGPLETVAARKLSRLDGGVANTPFAGAPDDMTVGEAADMVKQADELFEPPKRVDADIPPGSPEREIGFNNIEPDNIPETEMVMRDDGVEVPYTQLREQVAADVEVQQGRVNALMECLKRG